jgi:hypothetical protein
MVRIKTGPQHPQALGEKINDLCAKYDIPQLSSEGEA